MPATQHRQSFAIGTVLGDDKLRSRNFFMAQATGRLFQRQVDLLGEDHALNAHAIVGACAPMGLELSENKTRHFNGCVGGFVPTEPQLNDAVSQVHRIPGPLGLEKPAWPKQVPAVFGAADAYARSARSAGSRPKDMPC